MTTDKQGSKTLARTFFTQCRDSGYSPTQIIALATELLDLVSVELKEDKAAGEVMPERQMREETRPTA